MILYHGTTAKFNEFSMEFMGKNANSEGLGLYFSNSKEIAKQYAGSHGRVFTIDFNGKKGVSSDKITFSKEDIKILLLELQETRNILNDYNDVGYYGVERVLYETIDDLLRNNDNDTDILCELANVSGSKTEILRVVYEVLGYDHCMTNAEWGGDNGQEIICTIFAPDIFEIIDIEDYE